MKIAIITLHRVFNYGSVLQAYATQKLIEEITGNDAIIVDYYSPIRTPKAILMSGSLNINNPLKKFAYLFLKIFSIALKIKTFGGFLSKYCKLTKKYITFSDLLKDPPYADIYVTGSDQVWNSVYNRGIDKAFYLRFAPANAKKIAFVSSFGMSTIPDDEFEETSKYLHDYTAISVRESVSLDILAACGISNGRWLIDPTLQVQSSEWKKIASKKLVDEPYLILMLLYQEDEGATEYARKIADKKGLKLVKLSWELKRPPLVDKLMTHRSPEDFLSLFAYADFVVTNSFHGLAFAINFERQFVVVPRKEYNNRIESLLNLTGLKNRSVSSLDEALKACEETIDYSPVQKVLESERDSAKEFILENFK